MPSETYELNCPFCDKLYKLPRDKVIKHAGKSIHCRRCGKPFSIPALPPEDAPEEAFDAFPLADPQITHHVPHHVPLEVPEPSEEQATELSSAEAHHQPEEQPGAEIVAQPALEHPPAFEPASQESLSDEPPAWEQTPVEEVSEPYSPAIPFASGDIVEELPPMAAHTEAEIEAAEGDPTPAGPITAFDPVDYLSEPPAVDPTGRLETTSNSIDYFTSAATANEEPLHVHDRADEFESPVEEPAVEKEPSLNTVSGEAIGGLSTVDDGRLETFAPMSSPPELETPERETPEPETPEVETFDFGTPEPATSESASVEPVSFEPMSFEVAPPTPHISPPTPAARRAGRTPVAPVFVAEPDEPEPRRRGRFASRKQPIESESFAKPQQEISSLEIESRPTASPEPADVETDEEQTIESERLEQTTPIRPFEPESDDTGPVLSPQDEVPASDEAMPEPPEIAVTQLADLTAIRRSIVLLAIMSVVATLVLVAILLTMLGIIPKK